MEEKEQRSTQQNCVEPQDIGAKDLLKELVIVLKQRYPSAVEDQGDSAVVSFENGARFRVLVQTVN